MNTSLKRGQLLELQIEDLAFGARGVARFENLIWFVDYGLPGQKIEARIDRLHKNYGEATLVKILEPSPHQVDPPCSYFKICGGCQLQHMQYEAQVEAKSRQVKDILERIGGMVEIDMKPIIPAELIYGYRNKMEFTFSNRRWILKEGDQNQDKSFALGLHVPGRFDKVLDIEKCLLQSEAANKLLKNIKGLIKQTGLEPYDIKNHHGFWRFLVIREGKNTGELMLNIITSGQQPEKMKKTLDWIMHKLFWKHLELTTVIHSITDRKAQAATSESSRLLLGMGTILEKIGNLSFEISPNAFFQTNTTQTERLYQVIAELGEFHGSETVYDLYCGMGSIGAYIANQVKQIVSVEVIEEAIEKGKLSLESNQISNINFVCGDMADVFSDDTLIKKYGRPDTVIFDPPRGGPHPNTIKHMLRIRPQKIIYISCNPPLMARDVKEFSRANYRLTKVQPVDMFPHTKHIEVVGILKSDE